MTAKRKADLLFGTGGPPESAPDQNTMGGMKEVVRLGLDTMEVEFVQGVRMGRDKAAEVGALSKELGLPLSVHAPYFINLASPEEEKVEASIVRLLDSARIGSLCGADRIIFHAGFFMGRDRDEVGAEISRNLKKVVDAALAEGLSHVTYMPELTGKESQYGSPEELFRLCNEVPGVYPCFDFSHLYARTVGECNGYDCFMKVLDDAVTSVGEAVLDNIHVHLSGIEFTKKGEKRHLNVEDSGIEYREVLRALKAAGAKGRVICESPDRGHDSTLFKTYWKSGA